MNRSLAMTSTRATAAVAAFAVALLVTGCSNSQFVSGTDVGPVTGAAIQGVVHGGQNPITSATVQLWTVGSGPYGATASALGASVQTLAGGSFTLGSYTCPSASTQTYITSTGGNPGLGTGTNANIVLAAGLGNCGSLGPSTFITINEVTTAATAYALGQYFTTTFGSGSTDSFGAPNTTQAQTGIANAFATIPNLVTIGTGVAVTSGTLTANSLTVTTTPEASKLNTVADILAACVNSPGGSSGDGSSCGTLFADVVTTSGTPPTDTLQAAVYMSLNPTSKNANGSTANLAALWGLIDSNSPFQSPLPLSSAPADWTIGIQYTGGTTPLNDPQNIAADGSGNIWVLNHNGTTSASLTELSGSGGGTVPPGTPEVNVSTIGGQSISVIQPRNEAIDTNGNVWITASTSPAYVVEYNAASPGSSVALADPTNKGAYGIMIDGSNNAFITHESGSSTFSVLEFLGGTLATTSVVEYPVYSPGSVNQQPEYGAIDTSGNLWVTNGSSTSGLEQNIFQMSGYNGSTVCTVFPCNVASDASLTETYTDMVSATGSIPTFSEPFGIAAGPGGVVYFANVTGSTLTKMTSTTAGTNFGSATSLNNPSYVAVDGSGNVWVSDKNSSPGTVSEFSSTGTVLSPTPVSPAITPVGFVHAGLTSAQGIAIDPSGNVWVANNVASTGGVFEIVGAAAPTVTPIALALKNGAVGAKP